MSPILKSKNVTLRPWKFEDKESLLKYANNSKISDNLRDRFPQPYTSEKADEWLKIAEVSSNENFAIECDSHAIGGIGLMLGADIYSCSAEIGYWLGEPYWGRGITTEAVKLLVDYAFKNFNLTRLYAGVFETNPASARVLEKSGFKFESRQIKAVIKNGKVMDQLLYVITR